MYKYYILYSLGIVSKMLDVFIYILIYRKLGKILFIVKIDVINKNIMNIF